MDNIVDEIKNILVDNKNNLPLNLNITKDIIILDKNKKYFIEKSSIDITDKNLSIIKINKEFYKRKFIFKKENYYNEEKYLIKYNNEIIHIDNSKYQYLVYVWSTLINNKNVF
jgi:hypothetical protein